MHGPASSDDVDALDALLDAGADIEAPGAVIAGGTPLDDAVGFGQWNAARRLVERGAQTAVWHAAALGLMVTRAPATACSILVAPIVWHPLVYLCRRRVTSQRVGRDERGSNAGQCEYPPPR